jgi:hypothetical protein
LIEKGERVETGDGRFDAYFEKVAELRKEADGLGDALGPVRAPLVSELGLARDVADADLFAEMRSRATKFRDYGVTLSLRLTPTPKLEPDRGSLGTDARQERLLAAIEEAANRGMTSFKKQAELRALAGRLDVERSEIAERIAKLRGDGANIDLIETEIVGAGRVLTGAQSRLDAHARLIAHFLLALAEAIDTGAAESLAAKCEEALANADARGTRGPKRAPRPQSRPAPKRPPSASPPPRPAPAAPPVQKPPPPAPKKPPPRSSDFDM